jgi:hypothetical protein
VFCSIPGHTGIPNNETANAAAREAALYGDLSPKELGAIMFAPFLFVLYFHSSQMTGHIYSTTNCRR